MTLRYQRPFNVVRPSESKSIDAQKPFIRK